MSVFNTNDIRGNCTRKVLREETTWKDNIKIYLRDTGSEIMD